VPVSKSRLPTFESVEVDVSAPQPRISMEEVKEGPAIEVIGSVFVGSKKPGDFEWMITRDEYKDSLFLFNDDEGRHDLSIKGQGTAIIRPYNNKGQYKNRPRSAGIITGSKTKGYTKLDSKSKAKIDESIEEARKIISEQGYKRVFYSADDKGDLGTGLFVVAPEVIRYTTERIKSLSQ
jgi:hypothetical protein